MISHLFFYQLVLVALVWLCLMLHWMWPSDPTLASPTILPPPPPRRKRRREPQPFAGLTRKPPCDACAHASGLRPLAPSVPPPRILPKRSSRNNYSNTWSWRVTLTVWTMNLRSTLASRCWPRSSTSGRVGSSRLLKRQHSAGGQLLRSRVLPGSLAEQSPRGWPNCMPPRPPPPTVSAAPEAVVSGLCRPIVPSRTTWNA